MHVNVSTLLESEPQDSTTIFNIEFVLYWSKKSLFSFLNIESESKHRRHFLAGADAGIFLGEFSKPSAVGRRVRCRRQVCFRRPKTPIPAPILDV